MGVYCDKTHHAEKARPGALGSSEPRERVSVAIDPSLVARSGVGSSPQRMTFLVRPETRNHQSETRGTRYNETCLKNAVQERLTEGRFTGQATK